MVNDKSGRSFAQPTALIRCRLEQCNGEVEVPHCVCGEQNLINALPNGRMLIVLSGLTVSKLKKMLRRRKRLRPRTGVAITDLDRLRKASLGIQVASPGHPS
jgi:hypothetical protein